MLEGTPNLEEEAKAKLLEGGESEDEKEFNALFEGINIDSLDEENRAKVDNALKGAAKFFSEKGMKKGEEKKDETKPDVPEKKQEEANQSDLEVIFFESKPEAELVKDDLKKIAESKGITLIQAWKSESWIQEKAKASYAERNEKEKNKGRIGSPSGIPATGMTEAEKISKRLSSDLPPGFSAEKPKM